jgi:hypothetical protein
VFEQNYRREGLFDAWGGRGGDEGVADEERGLTQMAILVTVHPNQTIPPGTASGGLHIFSGIVECVFKGDASGVITRDTMSFTVGRVNFAGLTSPPVASCTMSPASIAYDGTVADALWAIDSTQVPNFVNIDSGSGTADLQVIANLAVRGGNGMVLRANYILFFIPS